MSTKEALEEYDNCAASIFSLKNRKLWSLSERFRASALQEVVQRLVKSRGVGEEMLDSEGPEKGKVLVCVLSSTGEYKAVRSFRDPDGEIPWDDGVTIWEAARATTAASSFFKPQQLGRGLDAEMFLDAAIGRNNPTFHLLAEAAPELGYGRRLGCVVSIGTGTRNVQLRGLRNLLQAPVYYYRLIKTLKSTATDGEQTHRQVEQTLLSYRDCYFRFNVPDAAEQVSLHHYKKIPVLKSLTREYLAKSDVATKIQRVAEGLQTDSFDHGATLGLAGKNTQPATYF